MKTKGEKKWKNIQKSLQSKWKHKNNVFLESMLRVLSLTGNHNPPHLPRMPSKTVLISGPVVGPAQILIWPYGLFLCVLVWICVFLPPMSTAITTSAFYFVGALNDPLYIPKTQSLPNWSCGFTLQLVQLVGRFWVFFLSHTSPGFQLWFYFHLYMGVVHWGLLLRLPEGLGLAPVRARCEGVIAKHTRKQTHSEGHHK